MTEHPLPHESLSHIAIGVTDVDPDGHEIEFIEYPGDARTSAEPWRGRAD